MNSNPLISSSSLHRTDANNSSSTTSVLSESTIPSAQKAISTSQPLSSPLSPISPSRITSIASSPLIELQDLILKILPITGRNSLVIKELEKITNPEQQKEAIKLAITTITSWSNLDKDQIDWIDNNQFLYKIFSLRAANLRPSLIQFITDIATNQAARQINIKLDIADKYPWGALLGLPLMKLQFDRVENVDALISKLNKSIFSKSVFKDLKNAKNFTSLLQALILLCNTDLTSAQKFGVLEAPKSENFWKNLQHLLIILQLKRTDLIPNNGDIKLEEISTIAITSAEHLFATEEYIRIFGSYRIPDIMNIYYADTKQFLDRIPHLMNHIISVLTGTYREKRYSTEENLHLQKIPEEILLKWQENFVYSISENDLCLESVTNQDSTLFAHDTDDPQDLLLCGTEIPTCQSIHPDNAPARILAYLGNGQNRLLAVKDKKGRILARAIFRLMLDEKNKPVLFLERQYPLIDNKFFNVILSLAKKSADRLKLPLTAETHGYPKLTIRYLQGRVPYDATDALSAEGNSSSELFKIMSSVIYSP